MYDAPGGASPPFRADHVGSLLRPKELLDARARYQSGETTKAELRAMLREAARNTAALSAAQPPAHRKRRRKPGGSQ